MTRFEHLGMSTPFASTAIFYRKLLNPVRLANGILDSYNVCLESALIAIQALPYR